MVALRKRVMRMRISRGVLLLLMPIVAMAMPAWAQPDDAAAVRESVVQVVVMRDGEIERLGSGFVVADGGHVLTTAHLVADEPNIFVVPPTTGAQLLARLSYSNERTGLALLVVNGLASSVMTFATDGFDAGRSVYSAGIWPDNDESERTAEGDRTDPVSLAEGSVGRHRELPVEDGLPAVPLLEHNAMIPATGYGGPLLNECGEVAGMNRGPPGVSRWRLRRGRAPEGVVHALHVAVIVDLLQSRGIEVALGDSPCIGALATAQADAEESRAQLEEASGQVEATRQQLEEVEEVAEATREQLERTQQEKEQAAARATEAQARVSDLESQYEEAVRVGDEQAESLRDELEAARGEREMAQTAVGTLEDELAALEHRMAQDAVAQRSLLLWMGIGAGVILVLLAATMIVVQRRKSRQLRFAEVEAERARRQAEEAEKEVERADPNHPDCLLTGAKRDGARVTLKIPARLLGGDGAIIGRSPRNSTLLIDDPTLSREHARLFLEPADDALMLEDMQSTNGTRLNGRTLAARKPEPIRRGDEIEFGEVKVELDWNS